MPGVSRLTDDIVSRRRDFKMGETLTCEAGKNFYATEMKPLPEQGDLHNLLRYEEETGRLFWKAPVARRIKAGDEAFTSRDGRGYLCGGFKGKKYLAHRIIWKMVHGFDPLHIDHIDGNNLNNRADNLRSVTAQDNLRNRRIPSNSSSGHIGVTNKSGNYWRAYITVDNKTVNLGNFSTKAEAIAARKAAEKVLGFHNNHGRS